jgi:hypothetical protein
MPCSQCSDFSDCMPSASARLHYAGRRPTGGQAAARSRHCLLRRPGGAAVDGFPSGGDGRIPTLLLLTPSNPSLTLLSPLTSLPLSPCAFSMVSVGAYPVHIPEHLQPSCSAEAHRPGAAPPRASHCGRLPVGLPTPSALVQRAGRCHQMWLGNPAAPFPPLLACIHTPILPHDARLKLLCSVMVLCIPYRT